MVLNYHQKISFFLDYSLLYIKVGFLLFPLLNKFVPFHLYQKIRVHHYIIHIIYILNSTYLFHSYNQDLIKLLELDKNGFEYINKFFHFQSKMNQSQLLLFDLDYLNVLIYFQVLSHNELYLYFLEIIKKIIFVLHNFLSVKYQIL